MPNPVKRFWAWYERHYTLNVTVAACLFTLQLVHLTWLTGEVLWARATGDPLFTVDGIAGWLLYLIDYTEIPALVSVSVLYLNELRRGFDVRSAIYLVFLNTQWLHIFWITDEFVVNRFEGTATVSSLPTWLAWIAILIDYLELPVIVDTFRRMLVSLRRGGLRKGAEALTES
jgi:hypothetical protein